MNDRLCGRCITISQVMNMLTRKQRAQKVCGQTRSKIRDYKECLENNKTKLRSEQRFRSDAQMYLQKILTRFHSAQTMIGENINA